MKQEDKVSNEVAPTLALSSLETKRADARAYLGARWVKHPAYQFDPRHSNNPDLYVSARQRFLQSVTSAARRDREANPAFIRAEHIRAALS